MRERQVHVEMRDRILPGSRASRCARGRRLWIVSDPAAPADAVAIFGGGIEDRPLPPPPTTGKGCREDPVVECRPSGRPGSARSSNVQANREVLLRLGCRKRDRGVRRQSGEYPDEVLALREWAERTGAHSIVPTETLDSPSSLDAAPHFAADMDIACRRSIRRIRRDDWWKHEGGLIIFRTRSQVFLLPIDY